MYLLYFISILVQNMLIFGRIRYLSSSRLTRDAHLSTDQLSFLHSSSLFVLRLTKIFESMNINVSSRERLCYKVFEDKDTIVISIYYYYTQLNQGLVIEWARVCSPLDKSLATIQSQPNDNHAVKIAINLKC